jgi:hypothetical protein
VGEPFYDVGGALSNDGAVLVYYGDGDYTDGVQQGGSDVLIQSGANYPINNDLEERFGTSIAVGDFNKDATTNDWEDLLIGAYYYNSLVGRAYIYLTQDTAGGGFASATGEDDDAIFEETGTEWFGYSVAAGNFVSASETTSDVLIGAPGPVGSNGAAYVYWISGTTIDTTYDWRLLGSQFSGNGERLGFAVCAADVNGSGFDNIIFGCPEFYDAGDTPDNDNAGRVLVDWTIPEFSNLIVPTSIVITFAILYRRRRKK